MGRKSQLSVEQIAAAVKRREAGAPGPGLCCKPQACQAGEPIHSRAGIKNGNQKTW